MLILTLAHSWFSISQRHHWGSDSLDSKQNRAMAWAPDWLITIIRDRLVDRDILDATFFPVKNLPFSSVWIDSNTSWQVCFDSKTCLSFLLTNNVQQNYSYSGKHGVQKRNIAPKLLCARQGSHSDARRSEDEQNGGKFHTSFVSAMFGVWSNTRIWTPEAEHPIVVSSVAVNASVNSLLSQVGSVILFSGSKEHAGAAYNISNRRLHIYFVSTRCTGILPVANEDDQAKLLMRLKDTTSQKEKKTLRFAILQNLEVYDYNIDEVEIFNKQKRARA
jgi:hypothetical protein